ncbi:MAG: peptidoglycan D,D-transpeptidase FtsI family protein [Candidatus Nanopelagicales bacterium]
MTTTAPPRGPRTSTRRPGGRPPARPTPAPLRLGNPRRRAGFLLIGALVVLGLFTLRLLEIQAFRGDALAAAAVDQRTTTVAVLADRGNILDSHGVPLATTVEARNITTDQTLVSDPRATATAIASVIGGDVNDLTQKLTGDRRFAYVAKEVTPEDWRAIDDLGLPGIFSERTTKRVYPSGMVGANVIGFVGADGVGLGGIEYAHDDVLAGVDGWSTYERAAGGAAIPTAAMSHQDPVSGSSIQLTIDRDIQYVAQRALANEVAASGAESGSIVVMDPRTGDILALVDVPTFDPNDPGVANPADLGTRALSNAFEPGSTAKVMTMAAVLEEGGATPTTKFEIPGTLTRSGKEFHDASEHGTYNWDLTTILSQSSNIGTILAAETIDQGAYYDYLLKFGIGQPTGLNFPGETAGNVPAPDQWSGTTFPTLAFGQGMSVNAVQIADVFSTIANDGVRMPARLVVDPSQPQSEGIRVVSEHTARSLREMLEKVVMDGGTAPMAGIPGYRVGGKTGTAQVINPDCACYDGSTIGSFVGMAPIEAPELVIGVTIVKPQVEQLGGELAGPVFREVMTYALQARRVAPVTPASSSPGR